MRRAGEAVFAQESEILSEVPAERGLCQADSRAREGRAGCILPQEAGRTGLCWETEIFRSTEAAGCRGGAGDSVPFVRCPGLCHCVSPMWAWHQAASGPARARARSVLQPQRQTRRAGPPGFAARLPSLSLPCRIASLGFKNNIFFAPNLFGLFKNRKPR